MLSDRQKNWAALALGCALAFVVAEAGLRVYQLATRGVPFFSFLPGYQPTARFPLSPFLVFGPHLNRQLEGKRHPETSYFNFQGFRTHDTLGAKPAGQYRVFALGGSTTADLTNEEGIHWPLITERALHTAGRRDVKIYNASMSAYSSAHSLVRLEFDLLQYAPNMIIVNDNMNDLAVNYYAGLARRPIDANYLERYGRPEMTGVISNDDVVLSRVWHSLAARIEGLFAHSSPSLPPDYDISRGRTFFKRNLTNIVAIARANGIAVVLLTSPLCDSMAVYERMRRSEGEGALYPEFHHFAHDVDDYNEAIREVGRELSVPVVDMRREMPGDPVYYLDAMHNSAAGARLFGEKLAARLIAQLPPAAERTAR